MDLNGDGFGDILSGSYSRNEPPMAGLFQVLWGQKGVGKEEFSQRFANWNESLQAATKELNNGSSNRGAVDTYQKIYNERNAFMKEERTGFVWLFLRK